jgi:hypothetical protein
MVMWAASFAYVAAIAPDGALAQDGGPPELDLAAVTD